VTTLCRISELVERETEEYHKADPDPFDDRHPGTRELYMTSDGWEGEYKFSKETLSELRLVHVFSCGH